MIVCFSETCQICEIDINPDIFTIVTSMWEKERLEEKEYEWIIFFVEIHGIFRTVFVALLPLVFTFLHRKEEVNCLAIHIASIGKIKKVKTVYFDKYSPLLLFTGKKRSTFLGSHTQRFNGTPVGPGGEMLHTRLDIDVRLKLQGINLIDMVT